MKKLAFLFFFFLSPAAWATGAQTEATYNVIESSGNVDVSTSAWTSIPDTDITGCKRISISIDAYRTNTANMLIRFTNSSTPPTETDQGFTMTPSDPMWTFQMACGVYVWAISLHTSAEELFYTELR